MSDADWWSIPFKRVILNEQNVDLLAGMFSDPSKSATAFDVDSLGLEMRVQLRRKPTTTDRTVDPTEET